MSQVYGHFSLILSPKQSYQQPGESTCYFNRHRTVSQDIEARLFLLSVTQPTFPPALYGAKFIFIESKVDRPKDATGEMGQEKLNGLP